VKQSQNHPTALAYLSEVRGSVAGFLPAQGRGEKQKTPQPSRRHTTVLRQLIELIPAHLVPKLARETGVDDRARTFSPWSHVVTMLPMVNEKQIQGGTQVPWQSRFPVVFIWCWRVLNTAITARLACCPVRSSKRFPRSSR